MEKLYNRVIAIDTENVHHDGGIDYISMLTENDLLILMQSDESFKLKLEDIDTIRSWKCDIEVIKVKHGTANAMDFGLVAEIAYRFATLMDSSFYIISNDSGYRPIVTIWRARGINIKLFGSLECLQYEDIPNFILQGDKMEQAIKNIKENIAELEEQKCLLDEPGDLEKNKAYNKELLDSILGKASKTRKETILEIITANGSIGDVENSLHDLAISNREKYMNNIRANWDKFKHK